MKGGLTGTCRKRRLGIGFGVMIVLERYILRRMSGYFISATAASLGIVWTVQALAKINLVTDTGQSIGTFLKLACLLLPTVIPIVLPFCVLIGITQTLSAMNTDSEMAVIAAAGGSRRVAFRPALILAALASLTLLFVIHIVEPYSRQAVRRMVADANSDLFTLAIQEGTFKRVEDNLYVQITKRRADGRLGGIFVADSRDPEIDLIYYADEGVVSKTEEADLLLMENGEVHRRSTADGTLTVVRFTRYAFDLSAFTAAAEGLRLFPKDLATGYLLKPRPNDWTLINEPQKYRAELHKRFTLWTYPIVFAMIALAVAGSVRSHRDRRLDPTMTAAVLAMSVRWVGLYFEDLAGTSQAAGVMLYVIPAAAVLLAIWSIQTQRQLGRSAAPPIVRKFADAAQARAANILRPIFKRFFPAGERAGT